jgi:chromosome segregation ATPase
MGQSIDYRKIELVSQFAGLLEALSDPTLKDTLVEARKVIEEKKALLGPLSEKANLDALIDREEAKLGERKAKMEELFKQAEEEVSRQKAEAALVKEDAKEVLAQVRANELATKEALKSVKAREAELATLVQAVEEDKKQLAVVKADYEVMSAALAEKTAKLQQVLGA